MSGSPFTIQIPYDQVLLLVMALFMFVGATRGWYAEFITTVFLGALTAILFEPRLAAPIIEYVSKFFRLILAFIQGRFSVDPTQLLKRYATVQVPFDGKNPYLLLVIVLIAFVILSYSAHGATRGVAGLSRILGGLLGLLNGFLTVSLAKEYLLKYFQPKVAALQAQGIVAEGVSAQGVPQQVAVAVSGLPNGRLLQGEGWQIVAVLLAGMVLVLILSMLTDQPITRGGRRARAEGRNGG
jgi:uncharacterized membrane protein required for colicin V production